VNQLKKKVNGKREIQIECLVMVSGVLLAAMGMT